MFHFKKTTPILCLFFMILGGVNLSAQEATTVSDQEIEQYAQVYSGMLEVQLSTQQEMVSVIEQEGLELQKFSEIQQAQQDPSAELEVSDEEMQKYNSIAAELEKIQMAAQEKMKATIEEKGMSITRYQELSAQVQGDPELQKKIQTHLQ